MTSRVSTWYQLTDADSDAMRLKSAIDSAQDDSRQTIPIAEFAAEFLCAENPPKIRLFDFFYI